jgi:hypothetical protein
MFYLITADRKMSSIYYNKHKREYMTDSTNKPEELDRYGVWVKKPPRDKEADNKTALNSDDDFDIATDLPDFSSLDFDIDDNDQQIKSDDAEPQEDTFDIPSFDDISFDEITEPETNTASEMEAVEPEEDTVPEIVETENESVPEIGTVEPDIDNVSEETETSEPETVVQASQEEPVPGSADFSDISIDDFLPDGFSDESDESDESEGSSAAEETPEPADDSEDIDLEEFITADQKEAVPVVDEALPEETPLDIDLDFSNTEADETVQPAAATDDTAEAAPKFILPEENTAEKVTDQDMESVALSEFGLDDSVSDTGAEAEESASDTDDELATMFDSLNESDSGEKESEPLEKDTDTSAFENNTEDVDLSDFVEDIDAEEELSEHKPVGPEQGKEQIDYQMTVSADDDGDTEAAKSAEADGSDIPDTFDEESAFLTSDEPSAEVAADESITAKSTVLLNQIVSELSSLKNDIQGLKQDLAELKDRNSSPEPQPEKEPTGFFSDTEEDDTIALSGDEIDNILNNADFTNEEENAAPADLKTAADFDAEDGKELEEASSEEEPELSEATIQEEAPVFEEPEFDEEPEVPVVTEATVEQNTIPELSDAENIGQEEESVEEEPELSEATIQEEAPVFEEPEFDEEPEVPVVTEATVEQNTIPELSDAENIGQEEESVEEEPELSEATIQEEAPVFEEPELDEEPEVPPEEKEPEQQRDKPSELDTDNMFGDIDETVEIPEQIEDDIQPPADLSVDFDTESLEEPELDNMDFGLNDITENSSDEEIPDEISVPKVDDILVDSSSSDLMDSGDIDDLSHLPPALAETEENTAPEDFFAEELKEDPSMSDSLTEEKINYLHEDENAVNDTAETVQEIENDEPEEQAEETDEIPTDLKRDIKSVLSYMDQLLENLPEDKIAEFAKSEQFTTYKRLFSELGLA